MNRGDDAATIRNLNVKKRIKLQGNEGADKLRVLNSSAKSFETWLGAGNDLLKVLANSGPTTINAGSGADAIGVLTIAAALTYLLLRQQDAVGAVTFDDAIRSQVPHLSKTTHLNAVLASLDSQKPAKKTDIFEILQKVAEQQSRRGLIVLISDLFVPREGLFKGLNLLRYRGHDVLLFHVLDDAELDFDYSGSTRFEGLEEAGELVCDPRSLREGYLEAMNSYLEELRRFCSRSSIDYQTIRTSEHIDAVLAHYLNHRIGMQQSGRQ